MIRLGTALTAYPGSRAELAIVLLTSFALSGNMFLASRLGMLPVTGIAMIIIQIISSFIVIPLLLSLALAEPLRKLGQWSYAKVIQA
jgi:hypothetical protein